MKAILHRKYGAPGVLRVSDFDKPTAGENEILIKVHASTISPPDCAFRSGKPYIVRFFTGLMKPKAKTPGEMLAGEVAAVGTKVTQFKKGDRVFGSVFGAESGDAGSWAEYVRVHEDAALELIPENASYEEAAALVDGMQTALPFVRDGAKARPGLRILINGASGAIGTTAVQLAQHYGAEVTGVCSTKNRELVKALGATHVVDYTQDDFTTHENAYDVVFDVVAKSTFSRSKRALRPGGIYLTTGMSLRVLLQMAWTSKFGRRKAVFMATGMRPIPQKAADLSLARTLFKKRRVRVIIDRRYDLDQISEAHSYVEAGHKVGSVILNVAGDAQPLSKVA